MRIGTGERGGFDARLAAYLAAAGALGATQAYAAVVSNSTVQPFGVNGAVPIDFNSDGQVDYEIDHDRVDLGGGNNVDYLQLDKNDFNGASPGENLFPIQVFDTFPANSTPLNNTFSAGYVTPTATVGDYPAALLAGTTIGPGSTFDFQEADNFQGTGKTIRANRLIDEDATQADQILGGLSAAQVQVPTNGPNFLGLGGNVRYLGVRMGLNGFPDTYGWIGIRITNEADATGEVVGWAYDTSGAPINAGAIPEPGMGLFGLVGGLMICGRYFRKRVIGR